LQRWHWRADDGTLHLRVEPHWLEFTYPALPVWGLPPELEDGPWHRLLIYMLPRGRDDYVIKSLGRFKRFAPDFVVVRRGSRYACAAAPVRQLRPLMEHTADGRLGRRHFSAHAPHGYRWRMVDVADGKWLSHRARPGRPTLE